MEELSNKNNKQVKNNTDLKSILSSVGSDSKELIVDVCTKFVFSGEIL